VGWLFYGSEECKECLGRGLVGWKVCGCYLVLDERVKILLGWDGFRLHVLCGCKTSRLCLDVPLSSGDVTPA